MVTQAGVDVHEGHQILGLASCGHGCFSCSREFAQLQIARFPSGGQEEPCFQDQGYTMLRDSSAGFQVWMPENPAYCWLRA